MSKPDMVNHPPHYCRGKYEAIDVIEDWAKHTPVPQEIIPHLSNVLKYTLRAGDKDDLKQELGKVQWYITRALSKLDQTD